MRAGVILVLLMVCASNACPQDTTGVADLRRWKISLVGTAATFTIPDLIELPDVQEAQKRELAGMGVSLCWSRSLRTTWRITHTRGFLSSKTSTGADLDNKTYDIHSDIWANESRFELLLHNKRMLREGRGPYFIAGLLFRTIWERYRFEPSAYSYPTSQFDYLRSTSKKTWLELYGMPDVGIGYDRRMGPVGLHVEACATFFFTVDGAGGGGNPLSVRPCVNAGVGYRFGRAVTK